MTDPADSLRPVRLALFVFACLLPVVGCLRRQAEPPAVPIIPRAEDALTDGSPAEGRRLVPAKPEPWQKRPVGNPPKCGKGQHALNGACYYKANPEDFQPPCDAPTFEHKGVCYHAVAAPARPPSSIQE
jgi:hypothetical protein